MNTLEKANKFHENSRTLLRGGPKAVLFFGLKTIGHVPGSGSVEANVVSMRFS